MSRVGGDHGLGAGRGIDGDHALLADLGHEQPSVGSDSDALGPGQAIGHDPTRAGRDIDLGHRAGGDLGDINQVVLPRASAAGPRRSRVERCLPSALTLTRLELASSAT